MSKPRGKATVFLGAMPTNAPLPSPLAAKLKAVQEANIAAAKKRQRDEEELIQPPDSPQQDPTPSQAAVLDPEQAPAQAPRPSRAARSHSPGGGSSSNKEPELAKEVESVVKVKPVPKKRAK